jgi:hypothetical protein
VGARNIPIPCRGVTTTIWPKLITPGGLRGREEGKWLACLLVGPHTSRKYEQGLSIKALDVSWKSSATLESVSSVLWYSMFLERTMIAMEKNYMKFSQPVKNAEHSFYNLKLMFSKNQLRKPHKLSLGSRIHDYTPTTAIGLAECHSNQSTPPVHK